MTCSCGGDTAPIDFTIEMQDGSVMKGELYPDVAPKTVENFVKLCNENFYEGLIFHRVISGFMIQGGAFTEELYTGNMNQKAASSIKGEFATNGFENNLKHERGVISMARTNEPNSASSQFFIMHQDSASLDGNYAAFGRITEGLEIVDKIASVETDKLNAMFDDVPKEAQVIKTIKIDEE
ncbi:MAG: peptidylprolyl isomerase [Clostridia bacterium]|nr:peptidylprolyl isomerase [Clostridia bacterium]